MGKTFSINTLINKDYQTYEINEEWKKVIGTPAKNFQMLIWGEPGQGKTSFAMQLTKYLTNFGKVYYNSCEQGEGQSLKSAAILCGMDDIRPGKFMIGDRDTYPEMMKKLETNHARFVVIDSLQYARMTSLQYVEMQKKFRRKAFIVISWSRSGKPKGEYAKQIEYMVDIKTIVHAGVARSSSRYGATEPYTIFEKKTAFGEQLTLLNNN